MKMTWSKRSNTSELGWWIVHRQTALAAATVRSKATML